MVLSPHLNEFPKQSAPPVENEGYSIYCIIVLYYQLEF